MVGEREEDPYLSFRFKVEIDGQTLAGFNEVSGLTLEAELETVREGGVNTHQHELAGPAKYPSRVILKRGLTDNGALWSWCQKVAGGNIERADISIVLLDSSGESKQRWNFSQACPVKWSGPNFRAGMAEVAFETVELVHKGLLPG